MFSEYQFAISHVAKLIDRRQTNTSFYLTVNTGILAVITLLVRDSQLSDTWLLPGILVMLIAGFGACWIWRSLLFQYEGSLGWWYARLREFEEDMPDSARLVTREYEDLYAGGEDKPRKMISLTQKELALNWIFTGLYAVFTIGALIFWLV